MTTNRVNDADSEGLDPLAALGDADSRTHAALSDLLAWIYRTPSEPGAWAGLLARLAAFVGAERALHAGILPATQDEGVTLDGVAIALVPRLEPWHGDENGAGDGEARWTDALDGLSGLRPGRLQRRALRYQEGHHGAGIALIRGDRLLAVISFHRSRDRGPFPKVALRRLSWLTPHLQRAVELYLRLWRLELQQRAMLDAMDRLRLGVFMFDPRGLVCYANSSGRSLLDAEDGLGVGEGLLQAAEPDQNSLLAQIVDQAARDGDARRAGALAVERPSGRRPLQVVVAPLAAPDNGTDAYGPAAAAGLPSGVVVTKLDDRIISSADGLVAAVRSKAPGDKVTLTYSKPSGGDETVQVTLGRAQTR